MNNESKIDKGLQPYINDEDTKDKRFSINSLKKIIDNINLSGSLLDVGCGNGRLNNIYSSYFNKIVGIDKFREPNQKYYIDKFEFKKCDIFEINMLFDVIIFMGSFYLYHPYGYLETLSHTKKLLNSNGKIIIIDDKKRNTKSDLNKQFGYYDLDNICNSLHLKIYQTFEHENYLSVNIIEKII